MPPTSQSFQISFTIDLAPYAAGLKTMLSMTQAAGEQIVPLLNLQMAAPNTAIFDKQIAQLNAELQQLEQSQMKVAAGAEQVGAAEAQAGAQVASQAVPAVENLTKRNVAAAAAGEGHSQSIRGMRREFTAIFGAIGFMITSLDALGGFMGSNDKQMQKFTQSMDAGVSRGFGLAMMLQMIPKVTPGMAMGIGSVVAVGTAMLSFFDKTEEKAKAAQKAMESFLAGLKGGGVEELESVRDRLNAQISSQQKLIGTLNDLKADATKNLNIGAAFSYRSEANEAQEQLEKMLEQRDQVEKLMTSRQMTEVDARKEVDKLEIDNVRGKYEKEREEANKQLNDEIEKARQSVANETTKANLIGQARMAHSNKMKQIDFDEATERDAQEKTIRDISLETAKIVIDTEEQKELAAAKSEGAKIGITEKYGLLRLQMEEDQAISSLEIEKRRLQALGGPDAEEKIKSIIEQETALGNKYWSDQAKIQEDANIKRGEMPTGSILAQQEIVKKATEAFNKAQTDSSRLAAKEQLDIEKQKYNDMVAAYPTGSILAQQQKVKDAQEKLDNATTDITREAARKELEIEKDKLNRISESHAEYVEKIKRMKEEEKRAWMDEHQTAMAAIDTVSSAFGGFWQRAVIGQRQAKNEWDAIWLDMRKRALESLEKVLETEIQNMLIDAAMHQSKEAEKTAATAVNAGAQTAAVAGAAAAQTAIAVTAMTTTTGALMASMSMIAASAAPAATLVSIASFGGAATTGEAAVLAALGMTRAASTAIALKEGGEVPKGRRGYFEGEETEIVAPEKTFVQVVNEKLLPAILKKMTSAPALSPGMIDKLQQSRQSLPGEINTKALERKLDALIKMTRQVRDKDWVLKGNDLHLSYKKTDKIIQTQKF